MSNPRVATADNLELTTQVTPTQFVEYLNSHGPNTKCDFCGVGEYGVGTNIDGEFAPLVAAPVPTHKHVGVWFFIAACVECGNTKFFSANQVVRSVFKEA